AASIPLTVKPRAIVQARDVQGAAEPTPLPDHLYRFTEGPVILRREERYAWPSALVLAFALLGPPLFCAGWYAAWRRKYPDAARKARQSRSRAARHALKALGNVGKNKTACVAPAGVIMAAYLRQRLDFRAVEPTPAEAATHLQQAGFSSIL